MFKPDIINNKVFDILTKRKNIKTDDLAKEWDIPRITLDSIKNGNSNPTVRNLYKIVRGLGITMNDVFDDEDWKNDFPIQPDIVSEKIPIYNLNQNELMTKLINTQRELIECQKELFEIKIENEQIKKESAGNQNAHVG